MYTSGLTTQNGQNKYNFSKADKNKLFVINTRTYNVYNPKVLQI